MTLPACPSAARFTVKWQPGSGRPGLRAGVRAGTGSDGLLRLTGKSVSSAIISATWLLMPGSQNCAPLRLRPADDAAATRADR
jgi:hypothetical protein